MVVMVVAVLVFTGHSEWYVQAPAKIPVHPPGVISINKKWLMTVHRFVFTIK